MKARASGEPAKAADEIPPGRAPLFQRLHMNGDHRALAEAGAQAAFDVDRQGVGARHGHRPVHADVHFDGNRGPDAAGPQVVRLTHLGIGRHDAQNLLLHIGRKRTLQQLVQPRADQIEGHLEDEHRHDERRDGVGDTPLLAQKIGAGDADERPQRRQGVAAVVPGIGHDARAVDRTAFTDGVAVENLLDDDRHPSRHEGHQPRPGLVALVAAGVSIVVKEILYRYTVREGRAVDSPSVVANAWHHRSDALSSLGTLVGIACAYFLGQKWRIADPIAALVVAVFIFKVAFDLVRTGLNELLERSLPADVEEEILRIVTADPEVCQPHNLRTRRIGAAIAVEVHVRMDGAMTVARSHALTVDIERRLRARFGEGTMIAIHVEPLK